jgi:uncharacterized membrane protein YeaQ/YmgE (transglycosylase-associated protein family)
VVARQDTSAARVHLETLTSCSLSKAEVPVFRQQHLASNIGRRTVGFIVAIIIGGVIGWLASLIMKTNAQMGMIANIVVGVVGSLIGHWAAGALGIAAAGTLANWIISLVGAVVLIAILRAVGVFK